MINIALIGSGELGSRHLQSLVGIQNAIVTVVEPSPVSVGMARQRIMDVKSNDNLGTFFVNEIRDLPKNIDVAVIATGAGPRLPIIKNLLDHSRVRYLILEKVLFQSIGEYIDAKRIFENHDIKVWVNCPRRMFEFYASIKLSLSKDKPILMEVSGGNWGLACNSIHFIDLFSFLTGSSVVSVSTELLEKKIFPSKRPGHIEMFGILGVEFDDGHALKLCCARDNQPVEIKIFSGGGDYIVNEVNRCIFFNGIVADIKADVKYQSDLTRLVVEEALVHGQSRLPNFNESSAQHIHLIRSLLSFYNKVVRAKTSILPIT